MNYEGAEFTRRSFEEPEKVKSELLSAVREHLPEGYDMETHFTPSYRPWRQRIAFVGRHDADHVGHDTGLSLLRLDANHAQLFRVQPETPSIQCVRSMAKSIL